MERGLVLQILYISAHRILRFMIIGSSLIMVEAGKLGTTFGLGFATIRS